MIILLDIDTPALGQLTIAGTLVFDEQDLSLTAEGVTVSGTLAIGSAESPFTHKAVITLTGSISDAATARGIMVHNGTLALFGQIPNQAWTVINDHAPANATELNLVSSVNWKSGDQIIIAPTDFYGIASTEQLTVESVDNNTLRLGSPLQSFRWGKLQYVTSSGMSLTPGALPDLPAESVPTVLDERAEIGVLTRNIIIQSTNDASWSNEGFGAHVMIMGENSNTWIEGVEFRRVGQAGRQGRYPIHFHLLSYDEQGNEIPKNGTRVVRYNSISNSANRCITIHGTNEVLLDNNICFDILGHAIFLEDAVERRNILTNNLVLKVRFPAAQNRLITSDSQGDGNGSAGFWITNPDNTVRGNHVADSRGNGFWLSFPRQALGMNKAVDIKPFRLPILLFSENTAHSNHEVNFQLDWIPINDAGDLTANHYAPTTDLQEPNGENNIRFLFSKLSSWKGGGIWNRPVGADFEEWVSADNVGMFFAGSGYQGRIRRILLVGESLNNANTWESVDPESPPTAFASYHSEYNMQDNILVNFPLYPAPEFRANGGSRLAHGGMLETKDYYVTPVDLGNVRIKNNVLINSHPGYRIPKPNKNGAHWALAGALWDPHGYWGPENNYWVYDMPFLTSGTNCVDVDPVGANSKSCVGPYYGLSDFNGKDVLVNDRFVRTFDVRRLDSNQQQIDQWLVRDGRTGDGFFDIMRHAALVKNGRFAFYLSNEVNGQEIPFHPSGDLSFHLTNFTRTDDAVTIGIPFTGNETAQAYLNSYAQPDRTRFDRPEQLVSLTRVNSLAEVLAGSGNRMWQDSANNMVWIQVKTPPRHDAAIDMDTVDLGTLHRGTWVRTYSCPYVIANRRVDDPARLLCE